MFVPQVLFLAGYMEPQCTYISKQQEFPNHIIIELSDTISHPEQIIQSAILQAVMIAVYRMG